MAGIVLSFLVSVAILIVQLRIYEPTMWVAAWATIAAASAVAFCLAVNANLPISISIKGLLGGLSVAALVPIVGFTYTAFYLPSVAPANLTISATLNKASIDELSHSARIPFTITISNPLKVGVYLLAAYYDVIGRYGAVSQIEPSEFYTNEDYAALSGQTIRRFVGETSSTLLQEGRILPAGFFIQPGGSYTFGDVAAIPVAASYDEIQVNADLIVMRDDRVTLGPEFSTSAWPSWNSKGQNTPAPYWVLNGLPCSQHYIKWHGRLETGYLPGLIGSPKIVTVWYILPPITGNVIPVTGNVIPEIVGNISNVGDDSRAPTLDEEQANIQHYGFEFMLGNNITESTVQLNIHG
jgi:hypothetical protein